MWRILCFLGIQLVPKEAKACSVCYCGDPTLLPFGISQPKSGNLRLSLDGSYVHKEAGTDPASRISRHLGENESFETQDEFRLSITGSFVLKNYEFSAIVPWISKNLLTKRGAAIERESLAGAGDLELYIRRTWPLSHRLSRTQHFLGASFGSKLPTGRHGLEQEGVPLDPHIQPGSGSLDLVAGIFHLYDADPVSIYSSLLFRKNGTGNGFQYGSSLLFNTAFRYRFSDRVLLGTEINGRGTQRDVGEGLVDENSGGWIVFASPQLVVRLADRWVLRSKVQIPIWENLFGEQREAPVIQLGSSYDF